MRNGRLFLPAPRITPVLDPGFRPAVLADRWFRGQVAATDAPVRVDVALEQSDGSVNRATTEVLPVGHPEAGANSIHLERWLKWLLWTRGGCRIWFAGPETLGNALRQHYRDSATGRFDASIMGERIYEQPFEVIVCEPDQLPAEKAATQALGRNLDGCRIGFDLGGSDRKVAAVADGEAVFSEEVVWDPVIQTDPEYHYRGVMDSLRRAAAHLPRVDAIGGSAAGVYVNNRVKVASLFRCVPPALFESRVKNLFLDLRREWNNVPFEVVNDGEVTALAGSMALRDNGVLGVALGTSTAGGYVNCDGNITSWLNELAFAPVDLNPVASQDEWSRDRGVGCRYFSQQCVGRLVDVAGIEVPEHLPLPEVLKEVQTLMAAEDHRARKVYETIGVYLGYTIPRWLDFYDFRHLLILGRVTSGPGGEVILEQARRVLRTEFPDLADCVALHTPDEKQKRHGQAIAAASLPCLKSS